MDAELRDKWVKALRSGKFEQGRWALRTPAGRNCCLGVLAAVMGCEWRYGDPILEGKSLMHPQGEWLKESACGIPTDAQKSLSYMNDTDCSFEQIAAHIEANL